MSAAPLFKALSFSKLTGIFKDKKHSTVESQPTLRNSKSTPNLKREELPIGRIKRSTSR